ncbi:MAG TPA: hypothetical protein VJV78_00830 [Polyangiales bacterium]|nr:hypothetical protein [Polyangiales bacterium]
MGILIHRRSWLIGSAALLLAALLAPAVAPAQPRAAPLLLVLMAASAGVSDIPRSTLRRAFEGYPAELERFRLIPFNYNVGVAARISMDRSLLGLEPSQVGRYWTDRKIRQMLLPPRTITSVELMLRVLVSLNGAIGYAEMEPSAVPPGVRALAVDGRKPSDPAYPLRR